MRVAAYTHGVRMVMVQHDATCRRRCRCEDKSGNWHGRCPEPRCGQPITGCTQPGMASAILTHMDQWHHIPQKGNA